MSSISFGALVKAQNSLGKRKREAKPVDGSNNTQSPHRHLRGTNDGIKEKDLDHAESKSTKDTDEPSRSSKHAPAELSSKKAVSRKREVIAVPKRDVRDPRFGPLTGRINEMQTKSNYAFLDAYRDDEMAALRDQIKKTKDQSAKETLQRELLSMVHSPSPSPSNLV
jgi:ribosomal RNA-processing protein 36